MKATCRLYKSLFWHLHVRPGWSPRQVSLLSLLALACATRMAAADATVMEEEACRVHKSFGTPAELKKEVFADQAALEVRV